MYQIPAITYSDCGRLYTETGHLIDDRSLPYSTLGQRRLRIAEKDLYRLNRGAFNLADMLASRIRTFVDSNGVPFHYCLGKQGHIRYKKIKSVTLEDDYSILFVHEVNFPIKVPRPPAPAQTWVGMLYIDNSPWILYCYSEEQKPPHRKRV